MARRTSVILTVLVAVLVSIMGVFLVYSASRRSFGYELALRQLIWIVLGIVVAVAITRFSAREIFKYHWLIYVGGCVLLLLTLLFGVEIRGDQSWLDFGLFYVQSSELMKPILLVSLSVVSERISRGITSLFVGLVQLVLLVTIPVVMILLQPDFGTALVYLIMFVVWLMVLGLYRETVLLTIIGFTTSLGVLSHLTVWSKLIPSYFNDFLLNLIPIFGSNGMMVWLVLGSVIALFDVVPYFFGSRVSWTGMVVSGICFYFVGRRGIRFLAEYQIERLRVFLDPYQNPLSSGYNVIQSQIAIGSGGWFGQGYLQGNQSQLGFIPELWTDFIFSIAIEELGLLFGLGLIMILLLLVYSAFTSAALADDPKRYFVCSGVAGFWLIHIAFNLGVCVGLLPVVGLPLPFTSYGGSFMVTNWIMLSLIICVSGKRQTGTTLSSPVQYG